MKNRRFTPYLVLAGFTSALITTNLVFEDPVPVHADFGEFASLTDYVDAASGSDAVGIASAAPAVAGGLWAIRVALENPIHASGYVDASTINYLSGIYYLDGVEKIGSLCYEAGNFATDTGLVVCGSDDYYITISGASQGYVMENYQGVIQFLGRCSSYDSSESIFFSNSIQHTLVGGSYLCGSPGFYRGCEFTFSRVASFTSTTTLSEFLAPSDIQGNSHIPACPFQAFQTFTLPSGDIDYSNPDLYLENVFRPWVELNYPDYVYLLPEAPQPSSEYATDDIVPGIPKDWTIINPDLPSAPHFEISKPDADLTVLDPSVTLSDFSNPIGFWFTLLDRTLDAVHLKPILFVALAFGLLTYIFWKLGR